MLNTEEELELPLYFYIEPEFAEDKALESTNEIRIIYKFFPCKK